MRIFPLLVCLLLLGVMGLGALACGFGYEAVATGSNPGSWWQMLLTMVVAPFIGIVWCAAKLLKND